MATQSALEKSLMAAATLYKQSLESLLWVDRLGGLISGQDRIRPNHRSQAVFKFYRQISLNNNWWGRGRFRGHRLEKTEKYIRGLMNK